MVQGLAAVKQINVAKQKIDNGASFFDYKQNTRSGEYQFQHLDVKFHPSCSVSGCPCHPGEVGPILDRLCAKVNCTSTSSSVSQEELTCSSPFVPDGSCCATCGARIKIEFNEMMNFDELSKLVYESVSQDYG
ncbi:unnamed protein product [Oikopleura dioica]|uniref:Protein amnionless n=1 Tax=Oikopleura dioica TaxID=34765 RepID=E4XI37_OIKDI|nr:unnamed protein product [Oikopleura dioica]